MFKRTLDEENSLPNSALNTISIVGTALKAL